MIAGEGSRKRIGPAEHLLDLTRHIADHSQATAASIDHDAGFPAEDMELLQAAGLLAAPMLPSAGGLGIGTAPGRTTLLLDVLTELGRGNLALGRLYEGHVNALQLVQVFGTPEQVAYAAVAVTAEGRLFGVWNSEDSSPGSGVSIARQGASCVLHGAKTFASGAGHVTRALVTATQADGRRQMCLVPMDDVPATVTTDFWQPLGMRASASHRVDFDGAIIEPYLMIGKPDDYIREPLFRGGAIRFAAVQVGGAQALLDAARQYVRLAGRAIEPLIQERSALAAIAIESSRLWLRAAAEVYDEYLSEACRDAASASAQAIAESLVDYANLTRSAIERACLEVLELVERSVGARGLLRPHPIERLVRDLRMYLRQPASDQTLLAIGAQVLQRATPSDRLWRPTRPC